MLWNWASHRRSPVTERHDSFLERFRDPDLKEINSRESNAQAAGHSDAVRERKWVNGLRVTSGFTFPKLMKNLSSNKWMKTLELNFCSKIRARTTRSLKDEEPYCQDHWAKKSCPLCLSQVIAASGHLLLTTWTTATTQTSKFERKHRLKVE